MSLDLHMYDCFLLNMTNYSLSPLTLSFCEGGMVGLSLLGIVLDQFLSHHGHIDLMNIEAIETVLWRVRCIRGVSLCYGLLLVPLHLENGYI
jgi:hypothetical protein